MVHHPTGDVPLDVYAVLTPASPTMQLHLTGCRNIAVAVAATPGARSYRVRGTLLALLEAPGLSVEPMEVS